MLIVMKGLLDIMNGGELEEQEYNLFKSYFYDIPGYTPEMLDSVPLIKILQRVCKDFSKIKLSEFIADDEPISYD